MKITTRAVLYVGYGCNLNCRFCYYHFSNKKIWKNIFLAKIEALIYRGIFGNDRVDITGGEPTIYPYILELVRFCKKIGLRPSIITNGIALADEKKVFSLKKAGIFDFIISVHGLGRTYDQIVCSPKASEIQQMGIKNLVNNNIPIRINVTLNKFNTTQLLNIAKYAVKINADVVNFICFNPFGDWSYFREIEFQERHSVMVPYLQKAIKILEKEGIESNIRYFPFCFLKGLESHQYNFSQLPYDSHEWDFMSWKKNFKTFPPFLFKRDKRKLSNYYQMEANSCIKGLNYHKTLKCQECALTNICDGLNRQYYNRFGDEELEPYKGELIKDPTTFIKKQFKIND